MTRDPLGKRALFSQPPKAQSKPPSGPFDLTVECTSCNTRTTLTPSQFVAQHFPFGAWLPWRRDSNLMRCPACHRLAWHTVTRAK
jgi:ribosomal protein L44E